MKLIRFGPGVLRSKYYRGKTKLEALEAKPVDFNEWRGIIESVDILCKGIGVAVGDGRRTYFWTQKWVIPKALIDLKRLQDNPPKNQKKELSREGKRSWHDRAPGMRAPCHPSVLLLLGFWHGTTGLHDMESPCQSSRSN